MQKIIIQNWSFPYSCLSRLGVLKNVNPREHKTNFSMRQICCQPNESCKTIFGGGQHTFWGGQNGSSLVLFKLFCGNGQENDFEMSQSHFEGGQKWQCWSNKSILSKESIVLVFENHFCYQPKEIVSADDKIMLIPK